MQLHEKQFGDTWERKQSTCLQVHKAMNSKDFIIPFSILLQLESSNSQPWGPAFFSIVQTFQSFMFKVC